MEAMTHRHDADQAPTNFRKSSYSNSGSGACVEVADAPSRVAVRDSKNPTGPALDFTTTGWQSFAHATGTA